jgi:hypothetical protein
MPADGRNFGERFHSGQSMFSREMREDVWGY